MSPHMRPAPRELGKGFRTVAALVAQQFAFVAVVRIEMPHKAAMLEEDSRTVWTLERHGVRAHMEQIVCILIVGIRAMWTLVGTSVLVATHMGSVVCDVGKANRTLLALVRQIVRMDAQMYLEFVAHLEVARAVGALIALLATVITPI